MTGGRGGGGDRCADALALGGPLGTLELSVFLRRLWLSRSGSVAQASPATSAVDLSLLGSVLREMTEGIPCLW